MKGRDFSHSSGVKIARFATVDFIDRQFLELGLLCSKKNKRKKDELHFNELALESNKM